MNSGKDVIVDDNIAPILKGSELLTKTSHDVHYAFIQITTNTLVYVHHLVLGPRPEGKVAHHHNGNTLDNRRVNLSYVDRSVNNHNRVKPGGIIPYFGVSRRKSGRYRGTVSKDGVRKWTPSYETAEQAAWARDLLALKIYEHHAKLNFPENFYKYMRMLDHSLYIKRCSSCRVIRPSSDFNKGHCRCKLCRITLKAK